MYDQTREQRRPSLVAIFSTRDEAHRALEAMHEEGFHDTWIGLTRAADTEYGTATSASAGIVVESDNALSRFFGMGDESLHKALLDHGVSEADAARVDATLAVNSAIVTVDGANHPELAAQILGECGGRMVTSTASTALYDSYADDSAEAPSSRRDLGEYRGGQKLDEPQRLQLREERLSIDKRRVSAGEAVVGKRIVESKTDVDVPVYHEELYIERRPASGSTANVGTIGDEEVVRVPLSRETVVTSKDTMAAGEVVVGVRRVEDVEHVSETLKREELDVDNTPNRP